jgi:kynureninase
MAMTLEEAEALDERDPLRDFAAEFDLPEGVIYLDGNSLGPPPRRALVKIHRCVDDEWREGLIRSWNDASWIDMPQRAGAKIARLIGAGPDEVLVCDSVSVNLFKLAGALLARKKGRALAVEADEFPTDQHIAAGLARLVDAPLTRIAAGERPPAGAGVLIKSHVHYKTAEIVDMDAEEEAARAADVDIIWDLSHSAGLVDVDVDKARARFAVGCGYKFLNGGPGAPGFVYVARAEADALDQPLSGWMGHAAPFAFRGDYEPAAGVLRFASGTPPILSLTALDAALDLFDGVDLRLVEKKARALGSLFLRQTESLGLAPLAAPARRGGHVCLKSDNGFAVMQALIARGVIGDFRAPNLMRFGFSPLYLSYADVWRAAAILSDILFTDEWRKPTYDRRGKVT